MATALYRRYRPEAFSEMIGQAHVTEPLMTAMRTERIGHAYLFSGPRGCGKTTSARILARCLNCVEGPTDTPCGVCPSCVELSRQGGGSLDVVEIDAASHGGVDDARDLRERAVFAPARDRFKIFIIDEAHMVTSGGFNALLKIVEEPPPHVKFIFATTEPEKVIGTIRSRTHHYPFRLIAPATLIEYVQTLCDSEDVDVEAGVLALVVRAGGGSVRDSLSILDQLIAGTESGPVTLERATGLLGYTSSELLDEMVVAVGARDAAAAFAATDRVVQTGQDPRRFVEDLLERFRDLIVVSATTVQGAATVFRGIPDDQLQRMFEQSQLFPRGELSRIADTVSEALDRMTGATAPRLQLELMVARALVAQHGTPMAVPAVSGQSSAATTVVPPVQVPIAAVHPTATAPGSSAPAPAPGSTAPAPAAPVPVASAPATPVPAAPVHATPASAAPVPAATTDPSVGEAIDIVATMKSAREFLRSGSAAASAAPNQRSADTESAPGPMSAAPTAAVKSAATESLAIAPTTSVASGSQLRPVGLDELLEVWPDLLDELLSEDRDAWNAASNVQPMGLDGDLLTIGVPSRSDLEAFKTAGARVLREAIEAALGITVKYKPTMLSAGAQLAARDRATDAEPSLESETVATAMPVGEQHLPNLVAKVQIETRSEPQAEAEAVAEAEAEAEAEAVTEAETPASVQPQPSPNSHGNNELPHVMRSVVEGAQGAQDTDDTEDTEDAEDAEGAQDTEDTEDADVATAYDPDFRVAENAFGDDDPYAEHSTSDIATEVQPAEELNPNRTVSSGSVAFAAAPIFDTSGTRYGESVVRAVLGARFIEERPLSRDRE